MSRWGINGGQGRRGYTGRGRGRGHGLGHNYSGANSASEKGLCTYLENNVFDYDHEVAADQMRSSWEKLFQNVSTKYGQDISNKLNNQIKLNIVTPVHWTEVLLRHTTGEALVPTGQSNIEEVRWAQASMLRKATTNNASDVNLPTKIEILDNKITK